MTREELIENICPSFIDCENTSCKSCEETLNKRLDEYDKQIRADVIDEFVRINKECQPSDKCQNKECVECIAEQLRRR